ncbi:MAG: SH3-like domain-containing protein [Gaiellaceae bacterium]|jgi:nitrile hydratase subunit beta
MTYAAGHRVRVADRTHVGHHRTPAYLKGRCGTVVRVHGAFPNPETRAYGDDGMPARRLYLVGFEHRDVWPGYGGRHTDRFYADIFEHWLEDAE